MRFVNGHDKSARSKRAPSGVEKAKKCRAAGCGPCGSSSGQSAARECKPSREILFREWMDRRTIAELLHMNRVGQTGARCPDETSPCPLAAARVSGLSCSCACSYQQTEATSHSTPLPARIGDWRCEGPSDVRLPRRPAKPRHSRVLPTAAAPRGEGNPRRRAVDGRLPSDGRGQERDGGGVIRMYL